MRCVARIRSRDQAGIHSAYLAFLAHFMGDYMCVYIYGRMQRCFACLLCVAVSMRRWARGEHDKLEMKRPLHLFLHPCFGVA
jgi:hypothetical protein